VGLRLRDLLGLAVAALAVPWKDTGDA